MTELLVGTKKGLFALEGEPGGPFEVTARAFAGEPVEYAMRDPRTGRLLASVTSPFYGPKIWHADDAAGEWQQADGVALPEGGGAALERIWVIVAGEADGALYAGGDPGVLFASADGGASWELKRSLWEQPTRPEWQPGGGGLCLHSIVPWPGEPDRLALGISAVGVWLTEDGGATWRHGNERPRRRATCRRGRAARRSTSACTTCTARPRGPSGCSCSSTAACTAPTTRARRGATSAPGCRPTSASRSSLDPADPDSAYVIPLEADVDRVTPGGRVRVYETRDAGATWTARGDGPARRGRLPDDPAPGVRPRAARATGSSCTSARRRATCSARRTPARRWFAAAEHLPPVYSVRASA